MKRAIAIALVGFSCISSGDVPCGEGICPSGTVCTPIATWPITDAQTTEPRCIQAADVATCASKGDGEMCTPVGHDDDSGECHSGACLFVECGNHVQDGSEICDDANDLPGDGCAFACKSDETCGNGKFDPVVNISTNPEEPIFTPRERCDDFNISPHDGCSQLCVVELPRWRERRSLTVPDRAGAAMAYDAYRGQFVLFGGGDLSARSLNDTWIGTVADCAGDNCVAWSEPALLDRPPPRLQHVMVFDNARGRVVLFGGIGFVGAAFNEREDTWEWDGRAWNQIAVTGPPSRSRGAAAYDVKRKRTVLFGGHTERTNLVFGLGDTWEWDGAQWTQIIPPQSPPKQEGHVMTYDPRRGVVVMFGLQTTGIGETPGTWEFDGADWKDVSPPANKSPPIREDAGMVFDVATNQVMLYGGTDRNGLELGDTWFWTGTEWIKQLNGPPRSLAAIASDVDRKRVVAVGGANSKENIVWNGVAWNQGKTQLTPQFLNETAMAYDSIRGRVVLFGTAGRETWELSGINWVRKAQNAGPTGASVAMTYDPAREETLLVSGGELWAWKDDKWEQRASPPVAPNGAAFTFDEKNRRAVLVGGAYDQSFHADTFVWDGTSWDMLMPTDQPPGRMFHGISYDARRDEVVLFGGLGVTGTLGDTWVLKDGNWIARPGPGPIARSKIGMAWNHPRGTVLLFGGLNTADASAQDTWEWDGTGWQQLPLDFAPPTRNAHSMTSSRDGVILFGGKNEGALGNDDTWELRYETSEPVDACGDRDSDFDGLVGCLDTDCVADCAPLCLPGDGTVDAETQEPIVKCAFGGPTCGDMKVDPLETCHTCPQDFPANACPAVCGDLICDSGDTTSCPGDCPP